MKKNVHSRLLQLRRKQ